jgi:uncharacterized protein YggE
MKTLFRKPLLIAAAMMAVILVAVACSNGDDDSPVPSLGLTTAQLQEIASGANTLSSINITADTGIHVSGFGQVTAKPDLAIISLGVEVFSKSVMAANATAATAITSILDTLEANDVEEQDIQTAFFNIRSEYTFQEVIKEGLRHSVRRLTGYTVSNTLTVKVRDLDKVGIIIHGAVESGGDVTRVNSIQLTLDDGVEMEEEARALAVRDAVAKAEQFAREAGISRGKLMLITESSTPSFPAQGPSVTRLESTNGAFAPTTPILGGEIEVTARVQAVFAID